MKTKPRLKLIHRHRDEKRAAFLAQIEACKRDVAAWPDWMKQTGIAPPWMTNHATDL